MARIDDFDLAAFDETGHQIMGIDWNNGVVFAGDYRYRLDDIEALEQKSPDKAIPPDPLHKLCAEKLSREMTLYPYDRYRYDPTDFEELEYADRNQYDLADIESTEWVRPDKTNQYFYRACIWPGAKVDPVKERLWEQRRIKRRRRAGVNPIPPTETEESRLFSLAYFETEKIYASIHQVGFKALGDKKATAQWKKATLRRFHEGPGEFVLIQEKHLLNDILYSFSEVQQKRDFFKRLIARVMEDYGCPMSENQVLKKIKTIKKQT